MTYVTKLRIFLAVALCAGLAAGCSSERQPPTTPTAAAPWLFGGWPARPSTPPALVQCAEATPATTTGVIGPLGGTLSVANVKVVVPPNAVLAPTSFTLSVPPTRYVELDVKAGDADHFLFSSPVLVSIDYGRCGSSLDGTRLSVWNIDPATKALLEQMPSVDLKLTRTITFTTLHFSGYAVAD